jgi:hypothetical protein
VVDADAYINKPFKIDLGYPCFYLGRDQHHTPYFECFKLLCNLSRVYPHSFISEVMQFKRGVIRNLLSNTHYSIKEFIDRSVECINIINDGSSFSEYEFYGNYVTKNWPNFYQYNYIKVFNQHKNRKWTEDEIKQYVNKYKNADYDILTMHSWI